MWEFKMPSVYRTLRLTLVLCLLVGDCFAADWTPDQSEVLQVVAAYTEASHQRDLNAYLSFWHPEFLGWHNGDDNPTDHEARSNGLKHYFDATKSLNYEFEPIAVQILSDGDAAIVHYKLRNVLEVRETGERIRGISYWTDYLVRDNDRWLLISDHGGSVPGQDKTN